MTAIPDEEPVLTPTQIHTRLGLLAAVHLLGMLLYCLPAHLVFSELMEKLWNAGLPDPLLRLIMQFYNALEWSLLLAPPVLVAVVIVLPVWREQARILLVIFGPLTVALFYLYASAFSYRLEISDEDLILHLTLPAVLFVAALVVSVLLRLAGYAIRFVAPALRNPVPGPLHFGLGTLLTVIGTAAALLGLLRFLKEIEPGSRLDMHFGRNFGSYCVETVRILCGVLLPVLAALSTTRVFLRTCVATGCLLLSCVAAMYFFDQQSLWENTRAYLLQFYICLLSAHVVSTCGYRLVRGPSETEEDQGQESEALQAEM